MQTRFDLTQADIPTQWYNLLPDFPEPLPPPLHPGTKQPVPPAALLRLFPENLVQQEMCQERHVEIPGEVRDIYALWRPTPLLRAVRFEKALQTPAHIYYKYEGASPAGSHKVNTSVPQAYFNKVAGTKRLATETGAGQWGSSLALACRLFGLECNVYMVKVSYQQKPYRRMLMMYTLGHKFMPPSIHAGGLRYHGMSPMVSHALKLGLMEAEAYHQTTVFEAGTLFARTEGIVPAPESAHAIASVVEEARRARESGRKRVILFNLSGHGLLDLSAYETYLTGNLADA